MQGPIITLRRISGANSGPLEVLTARLGPVRGLLSGRRSHCRSRAGISVNGGHAPAVTLSAYAFTIFLRPVSTFSVAFLESTSSLACLTIQS